MVVAAVVALAERGWRIRFSICTIEPGTTLDPINDCLVESNQLQESPPDRIDSMQTDVGASDGRRRAFNWTVPRDNGQAISGYVLRRTDDDGGNPYDYIFDCDSQSSSSVYPNQDPEAGTAARSCGSYTSACWTERFYCTGDFRDVDSTSPVWVGGSVAVVVGMDRWAAQPDPAYLEPTKAYRWKVVALNPQNRECVANGNCIWCHTYIHI